MTKPNLALDDLDPYVEFHPTEKKMNLFSASFRHLLCYKQQRKFFDGELMGLV